jgi:hypothetical protein
VTIIATQFALVLGAWRLRVRIDIDEPREVNVTQPARIHRYVRRRTTAGGFGPG